MIPWPLNQDYVDRDKIEEYKNRRKKKDKSRINGFGFVESLPLSIRKSICGWGYSSWANFDLFLVFDYDVDYIRLVNYLAGTLNLDLDTSAESIIVHISIK